LLLFAEKAGRRASGGSALPGKEAGPERSRVKKDSLEGKGSSPARERGGETVLPEGKGQSFACFQVIDKASGFAARKEGKTSRERDRQCLSVKRRSIRK